MASESESRRPGTTLEDLGNMFKYRGDIAREFIPRWNVEGFDVAIYGIAAVLVIIGLLGILGPSVVTVAKAVK